MIMIIPCPAAPGYFYDNFKKYMSVVIVLLIVSITVAGIFLIAFLWGVKTGQFEDDYSPASRILFDDKPASTTKTE